MDTMNKSVQTMNLEKVMSELKSLKSGGITYVQTASPGQQREEISAGSNLKPPGGAKEEEWVDPSDQAEIDKRKKEEDEGQHLLKPSDFFGM
jgi:hypothetical protein